MREVKFNVLSHEVQATHGENGHSDPMQGIFHSESPYRAFPYLGQIIVAAKRHPYAMLGLMISIAGVVIAAVVTVSVALFTGVFLMYGTMRDVQAKQEVILEQQAEIKGQVSVVKTYSATVLARQDFMVGLMTKENQERVNAYDRNNPRPLLPELNQEKKQ